MREFVGFALACVVGTMLIATIVGALGDYNKYDYQRKTLSEVEELKQVIDSGMINKFGNVFVFNKGTIDFDHNNVKVTDFAHKLKYLKLEYSDVQGVDLTGVGGEKLPARKLWAIKMNFTIDKAVHRRVRVVYKP